MLCPRCGLENDNNNTYCTKCGARLNGAAGEPAGTEALPPEQIKAGKQILLWGILSLAVPGVVLVLLTYLSELCNMTLNGFYLFLTAGAVLGIVLAMICKMKIRNYRDTYGALQGVARTGRGLSTAALWVNIVTGIMFGFTLPMLAETGLGNMTLDQLLSGEFLNGLLGTSAAPAVTPTAVPTATPVPTPGTLESL